MSHLHAKYLNCCQLPPCHDHPPSPGHPLLLLGLIRSPLSLSVHTLVPHRWAASSGQRVTSVHSGNSAPSGSGFLLTQGELNLRHSPLLFSHLASCHSVPATPASQVLAASASFRSQGSCMRCPLCQASFCRAPPKASSSSSFRSCLNVASLGRPPWDSQPTSHLKQSPVFVHSPPLEGKLHGGLGMLASLVFVTSKLKICPRN